MFYLFYRFGALVMTIAGLKSSQKATAMREVLASNDIRTVIANHLGVHIKRVTDDAHFTDDLGADRLDRLELMIAIEDRFPDVIITDEDVDQLEVVGDLIRHIKTWIARGDDLHRRGVAPMIRHVWLAPRNPPSSKSRCEQVILGGPADMQWRKVENMEIHPK